MEIKNIQELQWLSKQNREKLLLIFLKNGHPKVFVVSEGTRTNVAYPMDVIFSVLKEHAPGGVSFILAHNHPNQETYPSPEDIHVTQQVLQYFQNTPYHFQDHVLVTKNGVFSMRKNGYF